MKNTRKLIPALAMLLISAVMMSTASFAWFTMNSEVTATGMSVTAVAPDSIWISQNVETPVWGTTITLAYEGGTAPTTYTPVTPKETTTYNAWTFNQLTTAASQLVPPNGQITVGEDGKVVGSDGVVAYESSNSFFKDIIKIKLDADATKNVPVYVNASVSFDEDQLVNSRANIDQIYKAFRIAIVTNGDAVILAPEKATSDGTIEMAPLAADVADNQFVQLNGGATADVAVYVWIEGNDTDCMNANALNTDAFTIDLYFSIDIDKKLTAPADGD